MTTLTKFLLARFAEDRAVARAAIERNGEHWSTDDLGHNGSRINGTTNLGSPRAYPGSPELWDDEGALGMFPETANHVAQWDPDRVLAECAVKRSVLDLLIADSGDSRNAVRRGWAVEISHQYAAIYADHPDFDPAWRV